MRFTYEAYRGLVQLLRDEGYQITNYHGFGNVEGGSCVILRHDIDNSVGKAYQLAEIERGLGVSSTWFVLVTSEFYNPAAAANRGLLQEMAGMGHEIGLHFDEASYKGCSEEELRQAAEKERGMLEGILGLPITTVSMHRPSERTLRSDWDFPTMVNSYGKRFFSEFKYVSDSRMHWREDVEGIIRSHAYGRLHILTHAFWYAEGEETTKEKLEAYLGAARAERYRALDKNFRDLDEFVEWC